MLPLNLNLEQRVMWFVADITGTKVEKLQLGNRLGHDLGVDGEDAVEMLTKFGHIFEVDMSRFEFDKYFGPEAGFSLLNHIIWGSGPLLPLTVGDLVEFAQSGSCAAIPSSLKNV